MRQVGGACLIALFAALAVGCASPQEPRIEEMLRSVGPAEGHRRVAQYYRGEAAGARERAAEHRRLAEIYESLGGRDDRFAARAADHCNELASSANEQAVQYEALAMEHERIAHE